MLRVELSIGEMAAAQNYLVFIHDVGCCPLLYAISNLKTANKQHFDGVYFRR